MNEIIDFEDWINKCTTTHKVNAPLSRSKNCEEFRNKLMEKTSHLRGVFSISDRIKIYKTNLLQPVCKYCKEEPTLFRDGKFNFYCSSICSNHAKKIIVHIPTLEEFIKSARPNKKVVCYSKKIFQIYKDDIYSLTSFLVNPKISHRIISISMGLTTHPLCPVCKKKAVLYNRLDTSKLFHKHCSVSCASKSLESKEKRKNTNIERYGANSWSSSEIGRKTVSKIRKGVKISKKHATAIKSASQQKFWCAETITIMNNKDLFVKCMSSGKSPATITVDLGVSHGSMVNYAKKYGVHCKYMNQHGNGQTSKPEQEMIDYIRTLEDKIYTNSRKLLNPLELDVFIPAKNVAFEMNGIYWHSEKQGKGRNYHLKKTEECEAKDTKLYQIWDNEWDNPSKKEIWKSVIANALGKSKKIYARKCKIVKIADVSSFLNENHLQGEDKSKVIYALS